LYIFSEQLIALLTVNYGSVIMVNNRCFDQDIMQSERFGKGTYWCVFILFLTAYLLTMKGYPLFVDEELMYQTAVNLVEEGVPYTTFHPQITKTGRYGLSYSNFGLGQSFYEIPFYIMAKFLVPRSGLSSGFVLSAAVFPSAPVLMALIMTLFFWVSIGLKSRFSTALRNTLILGFCTMCWPYSKMLFRDPLQTLCLLLSAALLLRNTRQPSSVVVLGAGGAMGYGLIVKETMIIYVPLLLGYLLWTSRDKRVVNAAIFLAPCIAGGLFCLGYNYYRFNDFFDFCFTADNLAYGMSTPVGEGGFGLLFSSGRGFFVFNPVTVLMFAGIPSFYRRFRAETLLFLSLSIVTFGFYSKFWTWGGSWAWGPRFLLIITPFAVFFTGEGIDVCSRTRVKKTFVIILILLSIAVQIPGVTMHIAPYLSMIAHDLQLLPLTSGKGTEIRNDLIHVDFIPQFSPIWGLSWTMKHSLTLPFRDRLEIREAMRLDCPWRSISADWVPEYPDKALGAGPDLFPVLCKLNMPKAMTVVYTVYIVIACICILCCCLLWRRARIVQVDQ
jgi:Dolichyl-phosphate-mannose-protein mannosyltransferase